MFATCRTAILLSLFLSLLLLHASTSSATTTRRTGARRRACHAQPSLICSISPTAGNAVSGVVTFRPVFRKRVCAVRVAAHITGLTNRRHGFHIHTYGDITNSTGASTGGHFTNPAGDEIRHGLPNDAVRHWGDFGNLVVRRGGGVASYRRIDNVIKLRGIVGRGITIHAMRDQGAPAQPTGGSGARVGFCVIGFANPTSETL